MQKGYIKLFRQIKSHWLYEPNRKRTKLEAWQDILLTVNHSENKVFVNGEILPCKRGESLQSLGSWAKQFNWSKSKVARFFDLLEKDGMIETRAERQTTRLTVLNYENYQGDRHADETPNDTAEPPQKKTPAKKPQQKKPSVPQLKFDIEKVLFGVDERFHEPVRRWFNYKKNRKESYKDDDSASSLVRKIIRMSGNNPVLADEIVEHTMGNNWAGLRLPDNQQGQKKQSGKHARKQISDKF